MIINHLLLVVSMQEVMESDINMEESTTYSSELLSSKDMRNEVEQEQNIVEMNDLNTPMTDEVEGDEVIILDDETIIEDSEHRMTIGFVVGFLCLTFILL